MHSFIMKFKKQNTSLVTLGYWDNNSLSGKWEMRKDQTSFAQSFEVTKLLMREGSLWILSTKGKVEFEN